MRLTEVMTLFGDRMYQMPNNKSDYAIAVSKLGQLEDIEEELGVNLIDLLSKGEVLLLLFNYTRNIPFLFDPRKENDK